MDGRSQVGIVACCAVNDYLDGVVAEQRRSRKKSATRIRHIDALDARDGTIFLTYRDDAAVDALVGEVKSRDRLYDFTSEDGIAHRAWIIDVPAEVETLASAFAAVHGVSPTAIIAPLLQ